MILENDAAISWKILTVALQKQELCVILLTLLFQKQNNRETNKHKCIVVASAII
jgi:hypothetical protein